MTADADRLAAIRELLLSVRVPVEGHALLYAADGTMPLWDESDSDFQAVAEALETSELIAGTGAHKHLERSLRDAAGLRVMLQKSNAANDGLQARIEAVWDEGALAAFHTEYSPADAQVELERMRHHNPYRTESKTAGDQPEAVQSVTVDPERLADEREKLAWDEYVREHGYSTCPVEPDTGADFSAGFRAGLASVAAERDAEVRQALMAAGLAENCSVADLIRHHRGNASAALGFDVVRAEAERDALRARIEAAEALYFKHRQYDGGTLGSRMHAALAGDQPEATAEVTPEPCMNTIGPSSNGGRWGACSLPEGHWRDGSDCRDESAPEPPHLDPEPWVCTAPDFERYARASDYEGPHSVIFDPLPADENGKPYSDKWEDYP